MRIRDLQSTTGFKLSGNPEFHDWLIEGSRHEMPMRLEGHFNKLNKQNMKRRLFDIYKWQVGRADATRKEYADWLAGLADWMETEAESKTASKAEAKTKKAEKVEKKGKATQPEEAEMSDEQEGKQ